MSNDTRTLICGYCGKADCGNVGRGPHHWVDLDTYMDALIAEEDASDVDQDWGDYLESHDDYYRSMIHNEDI